MSLSTTEAIREEFRAAVREHLMSKLKGRSDWDRFEQIEDEAKQRTAQELDDWQRSYDTRLAEARQIILRETHGNLLEPPKPAGVDAVPDRQALDIKADQRIRQDHERRLAMIKQDELDQYEELQDELRGRDQLKGRAVEQFDQARKQPRDRPSRS
ncbi:MAG: hypothetical protein AAF441_17355 [Pseudomonadota bacterium]